MPATPTKSRTTHRSSRRRNFCPLQTDLVKLSTHQHGLLGAMRRLRRDLRRCRVCTRQERCPARQSFNARVEQAIQEISNEYHLVELYGEGESDD